MNFQLQPQTSAGPMNGRPTGEMVDDLLIIARTSEISIPFNLKDAPTFELFAKAFADKVPWIGSAPQRYTFQFNKHEKCSLNKPADWNNMLLLCKVLGIECVFVELEQAISNHRNHTFTDTAPKETIPDYFRSKKANQSNNHKTMGHIDLNTTPADVNSPQSFSVGGRMFRRSGTSTDFGDEFLPQQHVRDSSEHQTQYEQNTPPSQTQAASYRMQQSTYPAAHNNGINPILEPDSPAVLSADAERRKEKKKMQKRGEFYEGATTQIPKFDVCPNQPDVILKSANWNTYIRAVGQEFHGGVKEFRFKLIKYASKLGFRYKYIKNDADYVTAVCSLNNQDGCKWFVKASRCRITEAMVIRQANLIHTCTLSMMRNDSKRLGCSVLGDLVTNAVRAKPGLTAIALKESLLGDYGFVVSYEKVWRGLEVARANIYGNYEDSFDELRWYSEAILKTNPGSITCLETEPTENRFHRFFVAFHASLEGFRSCRPILFVDGTFMKTRYKGTLLVATAKDGNNGLFPVAMAVVDGENSDNWVWFLKKLKLVVKHNREIMNMYNAKRYSDLFKNVLCKLLKDAAYAPNTRLFEVAITAFTNHGGENAKKFLKDLPYDKWAVAFAPDVHRYGELTSNAAESFNSWILEARSLPITFMIDTIRMQIMQWFSERRSAADSWTGALTKNMEDQWNSDEAVSSSWSINPTNAEGVFEVLSNDSCVVNLQHGTCSCYMWQVKGFPCEHAIGVITRARWDIKQVVDPVFFSSTYKNVYKADIMPIPSTEKYEFIDLNAPAKILPPVIRRAVGRPQKKRFKAVCEKPPRRKKELCGRCGKYGTHFWTTCKDALY